MRYFCNEVPIRNNNVIGTLLDHIALTTFSDDKEITAGDFSARWINNKPSWNDYTVNFVFIMDDDLNNCDGIYYLKDKQTVAYISYADYPTETQLNSLAKRLYNTLDLFEKRCTSFEETKEDLKENPWAAIEYLLDMVENE